ncbi:MAG: M20/M25/M40 family metallo-hydrolase, partial [Syntrophobacteria bacterium]
QVLCEMLAQLKNEDGSIAIPGFYDDVEEIPSWEREEMASLPFSESDMKRYLGVDILAGEPGYTPMEQKTARPTLDINGIWGGFSGEGAKTIIPATAGAKVSMRLVPGQRSSRINALFKDFLHSIARPGVQVRITEFHGSDPVVVPRNQPGVQAAARAIETGFGKAPVFIREGGSIPIVSLFKEVLGCGNILLMGWGNPDDGAHSPNERFLLENFRRGTRSAAALFYELASEPGALGTKN